MLTLLFFLFFFFVFFFCFFFQAEDGIRDTSVTRVQTCALPICREAVCRLVGVDDLAVDRDLEDAPRAFLESGGEAVLLLDGLLQTGGLRQVVSLAAVLDLDVHRVLLVLGGSILLDAPGMSGDSAPEIDLDSGHGGARPDRHRSRDRRRARAPDEIGRASCRERVEY